MKESFSKSMSLLLLAGYLYSSLLVGGGLGPFTLYSDFWTCHCNDLYADQSGTRASLFDIFQKDSPIPGPTLLGISLDSGHASDAGDEDMCLSGLRIRKGVTDAQEERKICKRKLPLRYLNGLFTNTLALAGFGFYRIVKPGDLNSYPIPVRSDRPGDGHPFRNPRPPGLFA